MTRREGAPPNLLRYFVVATAVCYLGVRVIEALRLARATPAEDPTPVEDTTPVEDPTPTEDDA
ncbi:MAG: hypothetical protein AMXMBFR55_33030 [Gemmatimonadota bacterium]